MSIDISSGNYHFDIGNLQEIKKLISSGSDYPTFCRMLTYGKLKPSESEMLQNEIEKVQFDFVTSSGKDFNSELRKLLKDSIESNSEIIVHGIFKDNIPFDTRLQRLWGSSITEHEIILLATASETMSERKWEMVNVDLIDFYNKKINYQPVVRNGKIVALRCGIFLKEFLKDSIWKDLKEVVNKLKTYKFVIIIEQTQEEIDRTNFKEKIVLFKNILEK